MLTTGRSGGVFDQITRIYREYRMAQRAGAKAEVLVEIAGQLNKEIASVIQSPVAAQVFVTLLAIGKDRIQSIFDEARLSPCNAAESAYHARQAYEAFDVGISSLREWAADRRFAWLPIPFRRPLEARVPLQEIKRQVTNLEGVFVAALNAAELGTDELLGLRSPLVRLGADPGEVVKPTVLPSDSLIELPTGPFYSGRERVKKLRRILLRIADQLERAAKQGRKALDRATLGDGRTSVQPAAVSSVLTDLTFTIACGILTCGALRNLLSQPTLEELRKQSASSRDADEWEE